MERRQLAGHVWTIAPYARRSVFAPRFPASTVWTTEVPDARFGTARLHGLLTEQPGATELVAIVHGLGGSSASGYLAGAVRAASELGISSLRIDLRGADPDGADVYHAGLSDDLQAILASPAFAHYDRVYVLGYSLGGHVALHYATRPDVSARVRAVATICSPLDLERSSTAFDAPQRRFYREYVLRGLKRMLESVVRRRPEIADVREIRAIRTIRDWDERIIARRFGFGSAATYYARMSVAQRLARLQLPALLVAAEHDPMVPADTLRPALANASPDLDIRWIADGGHVGFPRSFDLGERARVGLEPQVLAYLRRAAGWPRARRDASARRCDTLSHPEDVTAG